MTAAPAAARADVDRQPAGRVGPNAVVQLDHALSSLFGRAVAQRVFAAAGLRALLVSPPDAMIDEAVPAALFQAVRRELPASDAGRAMLAAGERTADYILAHRIPAPVKALLKLLPAPLAAPLLLGAIERHAWTFAGSGACRTQARPAYAIEIERNPLAMPDCLWHQAVFWRLFRALVSARVRVRHTRCCAAGDEACRFEIEIG